MKVFSLSAVQDQIQWKGKGAFSSFSEALISMAKDSLKSHANSLLILSGLVFAPVLLSAQTVTQNFNTPGTFSFTVPPFVTQITVQAWGGGGGGRGDGSQSTGGGGGGAYASSVIAVTPGQVIPLTVGAGGVATSNPGQSGQASVFGNNQVVATGGTGGSNSGGAGGTVSASIGSTRFAGGNGGNRDQSLLGLTAGAGGGGGGSALINANGGNGASGNGNTGGNGGVGTGNGGRGGDNLSNGLNGLAPGGGGGGKGAEGLLTATFAGRGAGGRIRLTWVSPETDLQIAIAGSSAQTTIGKPVTFTVTVTNAGTIQAIETLASALLPNGITFVSASVSRGLFNKVSGEWVIGTLLNGQSATLTVVGVLNDTNAYTYTASVSSIVPDNVPTNNTANFTPNICKAGDVSPAFY